MVRPFKSSFIIREIFYKGRTFTTNIKSCGGLFLVLQKTLSQILYSSTSTTTSPLPNPFEVAVNFISPVLPFGLNITMHLPLKVFLVRPLKLLMSAGFALPMPAISPSPVMENVTGISAFGTSRSWSSTISTET